MSNIPGDIALEYLVKLKGELRKELDGLESNIAEIEAGEVIKRSHVQKLASELEGLFSMGLYPGGDISDGNADDLRGKLQEIFDKTDKENVKTEDGSRYSDKLNAFRSRLIMSINTLDLIAVALRKNAEMLQKQSEIETVRMTTETAVGSKAAPGSSAIIRSQESERHRIAREIHDGPAQAIANVVLRMDILSKIYEKDPSQVPDELKKMKKIAQNALDEIRGFIFDLRPMTLADLGLIATIKRVVSLIQDMTGTDIRLVVEGEERDLGQFVTLTVFRIAQESLNNLKKYAKCKHAWVHLKYLPDKVIMIVEDNGVGFDLEEVERHRNNYTSFGLLGMRERSNDINAEFSIESIKGEGTKVVLVVPTDFNPALDVKWDD